MSKINTNLMSNVRYGTSATKISKDVINISSNAITASGSGIKKAAARNNAKVEFLDLDTASTGKASFGSSSISGKNLGGIININGKTYKANEVETIYTDGHFIRIHNGKVIDDTRSKTQNKKVGGNVVIDGVTYKRNEIDIVETKDGYVAIKDSIVIFDSRNQGLNYGSGARKSPNYGSSSVTTETGTIPHYKSENKDDTPVKTVTRDDTDTKADFGSIVKYAKKVGFNISKDDISKVEKSGDNLVAYLKNGNKVTIDANTNKVTSVYVSSKDVTFYYKDGHVSGSSNPEISSIFSDANNGNGQYGGSQHDFKNNTEELLKNKDIMNILQNTFGTNDPEACAAYLRSINSMGCHFTALINSVFDQYKGREQEFYDTFGFPMYTVDKNGNIDYNYETLIVDIHSKYWTTSIDWESDGVWDHYGSGNIWDAASSANCQGINIYGAQFCYDYLKEKYGINGGVDIIENRMITEDEFNQLTESGKNIIINSNCYTLRNPDGSWAEDNYRYGHAMTVTGFTTDANGNRVMTVSNWGKEYLIYPTESFDYGGSFVYWDVVG